MGLDLTSGGAESMMHHHHMVHHVDHHHFGLDVKDAELAGEALVSSEHHSVESKHLSGDGQGSSPLGGETAS